MSMNALPITLSSRFTQAIAINGVLFIGARGIKQRILTNAGLLHALALGILLWTTLSWQGYSLCFSFLILGSLVTKVGKAEKEALGIAEKRGGARGPENLWGAAAVAAFCATCVWILDLLFSTQPLYRKIRRMFLVGYTASLATKISDTTASEIGKVYGKTSYLITTLQLVPRGTEGAVSFEGTLAGVIASAIAAIYGFGIGLLLGWADVVIVIGAAFIATTAESFIGATIQEDRKWSNEFVNFLNTAIGATVAMVMRFALM